MAIWFTVDVVAVMVVESYKSSSLFIDLILALAGLGIYALVVNAFGKHDRLIQSFTAIFGSSIVFSVVLFGGRLALPMMLTENEVNWAIQLIWFWSIPVEGHIIAHTIDRQWYVGFLIALSVLLAQWQLYAVLRPVLAPVT